MTERVTSRQNPLAVYIRRLGASRSFRREAGQFLAEGPKLLDEALRAGARVETVVAAEGAPLPPLPPTARHVAAPPALLQYLAPTQHSQGVLFVCALPAAALPPVLTGARYLALDGLQDPGNVGALWRTADALGADGLFLLGACADPFGPKTVRATMGACFRLPAWEIGWDTLSPALAAAGIPLCAAALDSRAEDLRDADLRRAAVVIGNEGSGVSQRALSLCQKTVRIPMRARCESLNAAVAGAVILWEMCRGDRPEPMESAPP